MTGKSGFTLIELVIVLIVLGILAGIAIPTYLTTIEKARATEAIQQIEEIKSSQDKEALARGAYKTTLTALGYPADPWTPQSLWNYTLLNSGNNIKAVRASGGSAGKYLQMVLGSINATTNQPGAAVWSGGDHPGQP